MRRRSTIEQLWRPVLSPSQWLLWAMLTPLSVAYGGALKLRARWWRRMGEVAPVATISIGNLTVGGNGKTPFTLYLANLLRARDYRVGIVSRGYGRQSSDSTAILVAKQGKLLKDARVAGDEPAMMAHSFEGPIAVAKRRIDGVRLLLAHGPLDAVLFDDAFQHLRLRRDLDLVLVASRGFGNGWVLPAGPMREPLNAVRRANAIVRVNVCDEGCSSPSRSQLAVLSGGLPILRMKLRPSALVKSTNGRWVESPLALDRRRVVAVCGLADSSGFRAMLHELGAEIVNLMEFPDHHFYEPNDWREILAAAVSADRVITTEKDMVKLERFSPIIESMYALRLAVILDQHDEMQLIQMALECIDRRTQVA